MDAYAVESQRRAAHAQQSGFFDKSIFPVKDAIGEVALAKDEYLRPGTTMADLAKLKPAFTQMGEDAGFDAVAIMRYPQVESINHVHTGGNSSGIVDGAAAMLVGSKRAARKSGIRPRARIVGFASIGSEPTIMLTGPAGASRRVLKRAGMKPSDIDLWEINEAFASVVLRYMRDMELSPDKVNVNGGAIAHGASARRHRRDRPQHRARRARAAQPVHRARHALRRRGHGHGHDHRARLTRHATRTGPVT